MSGTRRFKAIVSYDGSRYVGWQTQAHGISIQSTIEAAISSICLKKTSITGAGRTDAKVHAKGQCFHFDTDFYLDAPKWKQAINGHLPKDIRIVSLEEVDHRFHARFSVINKRYDYVINLGEYDVFTADYAMQCWYSLNIEAMRKAAAVFIGEHDFSSFCANSFAQTTDQTRTITRLELVEEGSFLRLIFEGKGFLRYMVRMITATLIEVGRGRLSIQDVQTMMDARNKEVCRYNAQPQGLYLVRIDYEVPKSEDEDKISQA